MPFYSSQARHFSLIKVENPDESDDDEMHNRVKDTDGGLQDLLLKYGYTFNIDDIGGIKMRDDTPQDDVQVTEGGDGKSVSINTNQKGLLMMMYTCTANGCGKKSAKTFSKSSYEKGVVLVRCDGCNNLHLVADNLGWFENDGIFKGRSVNIETILKEKGQNV